MPRLSFEERFWTKVDRRGPDECWPWTAGIDDKGYGSIGRSGRGTGTVSSHRAAYELTYGAIPEGSHLDHTCHNKTGCRGGNSCPHRRCCNPGHLEPVTRVENIARGEAGQWQTLKTHCPMDHEYTEENTFRNNGGRGCKTCRREWNRKYNAKRKLKK